MTRNRPASADPSPAAVSVKSEQPEGNVVSKPKLSVREDRDLTLLLTTVSPHSNNAQHLVHVP